MLRIISQKIPSLSTDSLLLSHSLCRHATLLGALRDDTKRGCKANLLSGVFFFQAKGKKKERIPFPLASKQKGKKDRLIAGYCKSE